MSCPFAEDEDPLLPVVDCPDIVDVCPVDLVVNVDVVVCCFVCFVSAGGRVSSISFSCGLFSYFCLVIFDVAEHSLVRIP
jgi:hypothetical protein